jgi:hypothetical protein
MRIGSRSRTGVAIAMAMSCVAVVLAIASVPAGAAAQKPTKFLGPVLTRSETSTVTLARDAGMSVALPNGRDFWVFGDTPRYHFAKGKWTNRGFVAGSSAADGPYARGHIPKPLNEVYLGHKRSTKNGPTVFIPPPHNTYFPDGSGRECSRANGAAEEGRWPAGVALMPNKSYVLVTYLLVCVPAVPNFTVEGWGFVLYNWKTNRIAAGPIDVFKPARSGASLSPVKTFGSPIVSGSNVTLFSYTCCSPGSVYTTTVAANLAALSKPGSYVSHAVSGLPTSFYLSVSGKSPTQPRVQLFELIDNKGRFAVYTAPNARGPWARKATGVLPGCKSSPQACYAMYAHPELSNAGGLMVSYYLPGYGPGVKGHPYPHPPINHLVMAAVPYAS